MNTPEGMSPREKELWLLRRAHEERHRCTIWRNVSLYTYHPFVDAPERQRLTDNDFLNTCNKAVPVYVFNRSCCYQRLFPIALHNYIYRRWFRPYRSELEHEQYVCKIIVPAILPHHDSSSRKTIESLVSLNKSLCDQVEARRPVYDAAVQGYMDIACERVPLKDHKYYQIQPLFRALLIIMDTKDYHSEGSEQIGDMRVSMVRTGVVDGLSAPITFESILGQGEVEASHDPDVVITTLRTAVDFVLALDNRERAAARDGMQSALVPAPEEWYTRHWKSYLGNEPVIFPSAKLVSDEKAEEYGRCGGFPAWDDMMVRMEERARRNNWTGLDLAKIRGSDHSSVEFP